MKFRRRKKKSKKKEEEEKAADQVSETGDAASSDKPSYDETGTSLPPPTPTDDTATSPVDEVTMATTPGDEEPRHVEFAMTTTANGDVVAGGDNKRTGSLSTEDVVKTPPPERKSSKLSAISRIFKPWKWRRRKKTSEKFQKTAVDLERKISVRSSREDLIKRGVLKELDENGQPVMIRDPIHEENENDEAVKEGRGDSDSGSCDHKQPNGSAATTPTLSLHNTDGHLPNSITGVGEDDNVAQTPPPTDHTISLSPEYHHHTQRPLSSPVQHSEKISYGDEVHRPESALVEPRQIRVILPLDSKDRQLPVLQKAATQIPVVHDQQHTNGTHVVHKQGMPHPEYSHHSPLPPHPGAPHHHHHHHHPHHSSTSTPSPLLNNNVYTPTGLTYPTPTLKAHPSYSPTTPVGPPGPMVEEVPISEPDLQKKPLRSAMKGGKSKEMLQRQLQQRLQEKARQLQQHEVTMGGHREYTAGQNGSLSRAPPKVAPKPRVRMVKVAMSDGSNKENLEYYDNVPDYDNLHSDSDEEIRYDERDRESILAARVQRSDSLARFLSQRPDRQILMDRNILPMYSDDERRQERDMIGNRLTRRLSLRPTFEDLANRNILHRQSNDDYLREKEEKKNTLIRKLSFRPSIDELKERKIIKFNDYFEVTDANEYDRRADKPWTRLTPKDKAAIRKELNEFKSTEMDVHDESRHLTRFHRP